MTNVFKKFDDEHLTKFVERLRDIFDNQIDRALSHRNNTRLFEHYCRKAGRMHVVGLDAGIELEVRRNRSDGHGSGKGGAGPRPLVT